MPKAFPGSADPRSGAVGNPVPTITPINQLDVTRLLPPSMLPQLPLQSPLAPGVALSTAIGQIQPGGFQPNFNQANFGNVLGNFPMPQFMPGNGFNEGNQIDRFEIFPGHAELLEELNRFDRERAPNLSEEMNVPPWLINTFSDRFSNPFTSGFPNSNIRPPSQPMIPVPNNIGIIPPTPGPIIGGGRKNPLKTDFLPPPGLKIESSDRNLKLKELAKNKRNHLKNKIETPMPPILPNVDPIRDTDEILFFLDDIFRKEIPKIPCSLKLYPAYKRVMVNLLLEYSSGARLNVNLLIMLWKDLKICGRFKLSKTNRLIQKLQRYDREISKDDDSKERKRSSKMTRDVIKKRIYLQKTLAKRFRDYGQLKVRGNRYRQGSSSSGDSRSDESGSFERLRRGRSGSRKRLIRGRWNTSGSSSGDSSNESD